MTDKTPSATLRISDHTFMRCGAGTKASDGACYIVRELGGRRDLCHHLDVTGSRACQEPKEAHDD